jgi:integrase
MRYGSNCCSGRIREITDMARTELALEQQTPLWILPAARAKGGRDVPRPLPALALAIIRRRLVAAGESPFVFASPFDNSQPIIPQTPARALQRAGIAGRILPLPEPTSANRQAGKLTPAERAQLWIKHGFTAHDLRRTARTYWAKLGVTPEVARKILGHVPPKTDVDAVVYNQHDFLHEMREALANWERHLLCVICQPASPVVIGEAA